MAHNVILGIYVVIGVVTLFLTIQRVIAGTWGRALLSGAIFSFCVWRLYQLLTEPSAPS